MKISLSLKLGIFVILLFATVIAACLLWTPLRIRYYLGKFHSSEPKERVKAVDGLLQIGLKGEKALAKELNGGAEEAQFLAKYWTDFDEVIQAEEYCRRPLHLAAEKGYRDASALLMEKGADVNGHNSDTDPNTPLFLAVINGHRSVAKLLVERGADVNAKFELPHVGRWTLLHVVSMLEEEGLGEYFAESLIEIGADVNSAAEDGCTPLRLAVLTSNKAVVEKLIANGANVNARLDNGKTPLDLALEMKHDEIVSLLRSHGAKTGEELKKEPGGK